MKRFFLHMINSGGRWPDEEGQFLPDIAAARTEALKGVRSYIGEEAKQGVIDLRGRVEIADEAGTVLEVVHFQHAFEVHVQGEPA